MAGLALALLAACGGGDPLGGLLAHQEAVLDRLEAHAAAPAEAGAAAERYVGEHREEIAALFAEARAVEAELARNPRRAVELAADHQEALRRVGDRMLALQKNRALMGDPAVRRALDAFKGP